ncbi:MAG: tetratricopeptide repeat protein [Candidatus Acidiferrales bacterium]|jgi:tetratricopeptide (TPR) repeat protein
MKSKRTILWLFAGLVVLFCGPAFSGAVPQGAAQKPAAEPVFDPLRAEKDIEVGRYYVKKGDIDAAIDRFQDATQARPNFALAYLLLGEAQEKKGLKAGAVSSYQQYLKILPHADDAGKIREKIAKLKRELARSAAGRRSN